MSQRSSAHGSRADSGRGLHPHANAGARRTDYIFGHGRHQIRLGPVTFWIAVGTLVIMAGWSLATGSYFAFHDDVLTRLIARQKDQQFAYEDRIAELRAQVDRITSRQLLNQEQFDQKLDQIMRRQTTLEQRAGALAGVDPTPTGSIRPRSSPLAEPAADVTKPSPISDTVNFTAPPARDARLESRETPHAIRRFASAAKPSAAGIDGAIDRLQKALDRVETRQTATLATLEERYDSKAKRIRSVLADLGMNNKKASAGVKLASVGGPFVPVTLRKDASSFERQLYRVQLARANSDKLSLTLTAVPVRKPIMGEVDLSSGFGVRVYPFLGRPAMHTGLDFRSNTGDPVRATANGVVKSAEWSGGYGKMVEIDHGNGFSTRYGHLSEIDVKVGQRIKIGQVIGLVGTTGRSTGPHLHYETRVDGDAVDPQKFLRAGIRLGSAL